MSGLTAGSPVRDLLADMTAESVAASSLDETALMLVRIAALVAVDAPVVSYLMNLDAASEVGIDAEKVRGVLAAVAPIVGTARVASAAGKIAKRWPWRSRSLAPRRLMRNSVSDPQQVRHMVCEHVIRRQDHRADHDGRLPDHLRSATSPRHRADQERRLRTTEETASDEPGRRWPRPGH